LTIHCRNIAASISVSRQNFGSTMTKKRNRSRPALPLQERLNQLAGHARKKAACLPPGRERERLMEVAVANEAAAVIDRWLASPGLRTPK
jgi:hypothetical protein